MHASKGRKYYACTEKRSQKRREIMVTITRRDLCRLALLSLMVAFDGRSYTFSLQVQQPSEFLSVMLTQWHVIRSRPRLTIRTLSHGFT